MNRQPDASLRLVTVLLVTLGSLIAFWYALGTFNTGKNARPWLFDLIQFLGCLIVLTVISGAFAIGHYQRTGRRTWFTLSKDDTVLIMMTLWGVFIALAVWLLFNSID